MAQRLVDLVDNEDAEHEHFGLLEEDLSVSLMAWDIWPRQSLEILEVINALTTDGTGLGMGSIDIRGEQRLALRDEVANMSVDNRLSVFIRSDKPMTTLEDVAILENVPGI